MIDALRAFGLEDLVEAPVSPNGHALGVCANCGAPVAIRKGATHLWCQKPECRRAAGAQRARDFRANRSKIAK